MLLRRSSCHYHERKKQIAKRQSKTTKTKLIMKSRRGQHRQELHRIKLELIRKGLTQDQKKSNEVSQILYNKPI